MRLRPDAKLILYALPFAFIAALIALGPHEVFGWFPGMKW